MAREAGGHEARLREIDAEVGNLVELGRLAGDVTEIADELRALQAERKQRRADVAASEVEVDEDAARAVLNARARDLGTQLRESPEKDRHALRALILNRLRVDSEGKVTGWAQLPQKEPTAEARGPDRRNVMVAGERFAPERGWRLLLAA